MKHPTPVSRETLRLTHRPCSVLGAGRLTATLWRTEGPDAVYGFNVVRTDATTGEVTQRFQPDDISDFIRLTQLLASEVARDQTLDPRSRDNLACLADALEEVMPSGFKFDGIRCPTEGPAFRSLTVLLAVLWDESGLDFMNRPSNQHVYRVLVSLDGWLRGAGPVAGAVPDDLDPLDIREVFGVCPICGRHDSYRNLHREQWFVCHEHQTRWFAGENILSTWRSESPEDWQQNITDIGHYRIVYPLRNPSVAEVND